MPKHIQAYQKIQNAKAKFNQEQYTSKLNTNIVQDKINQDTAENKDNKSDLEFIN